MRLSKRIGIIGCGNMGSAILAGLIQKRIASPSQVTVFDKILAKAKEVSRQWKVREGKGDFGYNARTDKFENLFAAGVIDPTKVSRIALENAASIAAMLLTTECVLAEQKEDAPAMPMGNPGMGGMGGMM